LKKSKKSEKYQDLRSYNQTNKQTNKQTNGCATVP